MKTVFFRWALILCLVAGSLLVASRLEIREDAIDLLPGAAVQGDFILLKRLGLVNRLFISLDATALPAGSDPFGMLTGSAEKTGAILADSELFRDVYYRMPAGYGQAMLDYVRSCLPALLTSADLAALAQRLEGKGLESALQEDFLLLNSPVGMGMKEQIQADPLGFSLVALKRIEGLKGELAVQVRDGFFMSADGLHCLIWAESKLSLTDSSSAEKVDTFVRAALAKGLAPGIKADIIGSLPHTLANSRTIRHDLDLLMPLAFIVFFVLFIVMLKDWRGVLVIAVPFLAGAPAVALYSLFYTKISAMALGFGIALVGIADDFSIHLFMALSKEQGGSKAIMRRLAGPLLLALVTTVVVFVVLLFSQVPSHRQMAFLAIAGIVMAFVLSWYLVPTLVKEHSLVKPAESVPELQGFRIDKFLPRSRLARSIAIVAWFLLAKANL